MDSKTETVSDNEAIARFMGGVFYGPEDLDNPNKWWFQEQPHNAYRKDAMHLAVGLRYNIDWSWLMPVVEKIAELDCVYHWTLTEGTFSINSDMTFENLGEGIEKVYVTVVYFLRWLNSQSPATIK